MLFTWLKHSHSVISLTCGDCHSQRRIQNPVKHLWWGTYAVNYFRKTLHLRCLDGILKTSLILNYNTRTWYKLDISCGWYNAYSLRNLESFGSHLTCCKICSVTKITSKINYRVIFQVTKNVLRCHPVNCDVSCIRKDSNISDWGWC